MPARDSLSPTPRPSGRRTRTVPCALSVPLLLLLAACDEVTEPPPTDLGPNTPRTASRAYRAIGGISMGGYGAANLGTKNDDLFSVVGALGGPVDMREMLEDIVEDNLEVKAQTAIPRAIGSDFTFDHQPPYPGRDTRLDMARDLFLAFGNPFLHHPMQTQQYLAVASQPAAIQRDDVFGDFDLPASNRGFVDGGDGNNNGLRETSEVPDQNTDVLLLARGTASGLANGKSPLLVGGRDLVDLNDDGVFDVGDGIVLNLSEPFTDDDGDGLFEPDQGEIYDDYGLDGVEGTNDFGEGNGSFDYDPDREHWLAEDPLLRLAGFSETRVRDLALYMDHGNDDQFGFAEHYDNLIAMLDARGIEVTERRGFSGDCSSVPDFQSPRIRFVYEGGHVGIPDIDDIDEQLTEGDFCSDTLLVWQRLRTFIGFCDSQFEDGDYGLGGLRPVGDIVTRAVPSPVLTPDGTPMRMRNLVVYRPPGFFNTSRSFPIVYFLCGYGQSPEDYERLQLLLDSLISTDEVQNMYFAFVPGSGGYRGSFYVDHVVPHDHTPELPATTARYETSLLEDLIPRVEDDILSGRVRRDTPR